jgi:hypothetical protein
MNSAGLIESMPALMRYNFHMPEPAAGFAAGAFVLVPAADLGVATMAAKNLLISASSEWPVLGSVAVNVDMFDSSIVCLLD